MFDNIYYIQHTIEIPFIGENIIYSDMLCISECIKWPKEETPKAESQEAVLFYS